MSTTDGNRSATTEKQTVLAFGPTSEETQITEEGFPDLPRRSSLMHVPSSVTHRKLVLAFDVGTTFSGISYWRAPKYCGLIAVPTDQRNTAFWILGKYLRSEVLRGMSLESLRCASLA